jgi:hypothetical protein
VARVKAPLSEDGWRRARVGGRNPPIETREGKEVGRDDFEGGLGVGGEPLLTWGAGSPLLIIFTLYLPIPTWEEVDQFRRELIKRRRQPINGTIWGNGVPSLSNGVYAASPPLVVVGGITFY